MAPSIIIAGVHIEHLRGFSSARIDLRSPLLLVGPNNAGKSSLFVLLETLFHWDMDLLQGERDLSGDEAEILLPSRDSRGKARRLRLRIALTERRDQTRFQAINGLTDLKLTVTAKRCRLTISPPTRARQMTEPPAVELLERLRSAYEYMWVPAGNEGVGRLAEKFRAGLEEQLLVRGAPSGHGGTTTEYRALRQIRESTTPQVRQLADSFQRALDLGVGRSLLKSVRIETDGSIEAAATWVASQVRFRVSTGQHDERGVTLDDLGSGLQSLLLIGLNRRRRELDRPHLLLGLEEPEAHLHPSLQHEVSRALLSQSDDDATVLISTHSSAFVSEAVYGQTVLVKNHEYFIPREASDQTRDAINTFLMQGRAAEMFFADSVLLVEGPGDYRFFDAIRRRLASDLGLSDAERMFCLEVGANTSFGPWLRLLRSYGDQGHRPIAWHVVCDGDSTGALPEGLVDSGQVVPQAARSALANLGSTSWNDMTRRALYASAASRELQRAGLDSRIWGGDLEWEILCDARPETVSAIAGLIGVDGGQSKQTIARRFGSKVSTGSASDSGKKAPWLRAEMGKLVRSDDLSLPMRELLLAWLAPVVASRAAARRALQRL